MAADIRKYHVMHVVENLEVGGMENGVVNLANRLDKERCTLSICCLSHPGALSKRLDAGINVISLNWRGGFSPGLFFEVARILVEQKVDIVHTHGWLTLLYCSLPSVFSRSVLINGEHGTFHLDNMRRKTAYQLISPLVKRYVAVSFSLEEELKRLLPVGKDKVLFIPNGVDTRKFCPGETGRIAAIKSGMGIPADACIVGSVGRLEPVKNYAMLLRAFAGIAAELPEIHCVLVGDGSLQHELRQAARDLGVGDRVHFTGKVDNTHDVMTIFDLFVCSSLSEGMSNTILEAMACGVPVIATDVGDNRKMVQDGHNGYIVASEDTPGLERTIRKLLAEQELLRRFGENARSMTEDAFCIDTMVGRYQEIYEHSLAGDWSPHAV